jgi:hypothetical protein
LETIQHSAGFGRMDARSGKERFPFAFVASQTCECFPKAEHDVP